MDIREKYKLLTQEQKAKFWEGFYILGKETDRYFARQRYFYHRRILRRKGII